MDILRQQTPLRRRHIIRRVFHVYLHHASFTVAEARVLVKVSLELVAAKSEVSMCFPLALCLLDGSLDIIWPVGVLFDGRVLFATDL